MIALHKTTEQESDFVNKVDFYELNFSFNKKNVPYEKLVENFDEFIKYLYLYSISPPLKKRNG